MPTGAEHVVPPAIQTSADEFADETKEGTSRRPRGSARPEALQHDTELLRLTPQATTNPLIPALAAIRINKPSGARLTSVLQLVDVPREEIVPFVAKTIAHPGRRAV